MAKVMITESYLEDIADAIREKKGGSDTYTPGEMAEAISSIDGGSTPVINSLNVTPSESQQVFNASNIDGYKPVTVAGIPLDYVGSGITRQDSLAYYPDSAGASIMASEGYYADDTSIIIPNAIVKGVSSISSSGATISAGTNTLTLTKTNVTNLPVIDAYGYIADGMQQSGSATVTLTASVTVNPTPTASGATVTIPAGYYSSQTTKSVTSGSASAPSTISGTSATVSTGTNTLTLTKTVSVTPTVSAGYISSGTATNSSVSLTAPVTTKAAATITPGTTNQTIASGTYLTGTQTIAGDSDLVGSNILSTANIFGVQGQVVVQNYYTGSSAPSSSLGSNGDLYLQS